MPLFLILVTVVLASCGGRFERSDKAVVVSLLGKTYTEPVRPPEVQAKLEKNLEEAWKNLQREQTEDNFVWVGRRLGYLSRFEEAIDVYNDGLKRFPNSAKLYRHRGHRFISLRRFDRAIDDLTKANALIPGFPFEEEPDGEPNKINKPLSSLQFNIRYHLGVAYYLKGDFFQANQAFVECLKTCTNDDLLVACVDWMYMTYRRMSMEDKAAVIVNNVHDHMTIVENDAYYRRCRMYQGHVSPDSLLMVDPAHDDNGLTLATQGYGVGNWYLCKGDSARAYEILQKVTEGPHFAAFGFIAAEAELARRKK